MAEPEHPSIEFAVVTPTGITHTPDGSTLDLHMVASSTAAAEKVAQEFTEQTGADVEIRTHEHNTPSTTTTSTSKTIGFGGTSWRRSTWVPEADRRREALREAARRTPPAANPRAN